MPQYLPLVNWFPSLKSSANIPSQEVSKDPLKTFSETPAHEVFGRLGFCHLARSLACQEMWMSWSAKDIVSAVDLLLHMRVDVYTEMNHLQLRQGLSIYLTNRVLGRSKSCVFSIFPMAESPQEEECTQLLYAVQVRLQDLWMNFRIELWSEWQGTAEGGKYNYFSEIFVI